MSGLNIGTRDLKVQNSTKKKLINSGQNNFQRPRSNSLSLTKLPNKKVNPTQFNGAKSNLSEPEDTLALNLLFKALDERDYQILGFLLKNLKHKPHLMNASYKDWDESILPNDPSFKVTLGPMTLLAKACMLNDLGLIMILKSYGCDLNLHNSIGLRCASYLRSMEIIQYLMISGCLLPKIVPGQTNHPLTEAVKNGDLEMVNLLLMTSSDTKSSQGPQSDLYDNLLCNACSDGHVSIIDHLLNKHHLNQISLKCFDKKKPLIAALQNNHFHIIRLLLDKIYDVPIDGALGTKAEYKEMADVKLVKNDVTESSLLSANTQETTKEESELILSPTGQSITSNEDPVTPTSELCESEPIDNEKSFKVLSEGESPPSDNEIKVSNKKAELQSKIEDKTVNIEVKNESNKSDDIDKSNTDEKSEDNNDVNAINSQLAQNENVDNLSKEVNGKSDITPVVEIIGSDTKSEINIQSNVKEIETDFKETECYKANKETQTDIIESSETNLEGLETQNIDGLKAESSSIEALKGTENPKADISISAYSDDDKETEISMIKEETVVEQLNVKKAHENDITLNEEAPISNQEHMISDFSILEDTNNKESEISELPESTSVPENFENGVESQGQSKIIDSSDVNNLSSKIETENDPIVQTEKSKEEFKGSIEDEDASTISEIKVSEDIEELENDTFNHETLEQVDVVSTNEKEEVAVVDVTETSALYSDGKSRDNIEVITKGDDMDLDKKEQSIEIKEDILDEKLIEIEKTNKLEDIVEIKSSCDQNNTNKDLLDKSDKIETHLEIDTLSYKEASNSEDALMEENSIIQAEAENAEVKEHSDSVEPTDQGLEVNEITETEVSLNTEPVDTQESKATEEDKKIEAESAEKEEPNATEQDLNERGAIQESIMESTREQSLETLTMLKESFDGESPTLPKEVPVKVEKLSETTKDINEVNDETLHVKSVDSIAIEESIHIVESVDDTFDREEETSSIECTPNQAKVEVVSNTTQTHVEELIKDEESEPISSQVEPQTLSTLAPVILEESTGVDELNISTSTPIEINISNSFVQEPNEKSVKDQELNENSSTQNNVDIWEESKESSKVDETNEVITMHNKEEPSISSNLMPVNESEKDDKPDRSIIEEAKVEIMISSTLDHDLIEDEVLNEKSTQALEEATAVPTQLQQEKVEGEKLIELTINEANIEAQTYKLTSADEASKAYEPETSQTEVEPLTIAVSIKEEAQETPELVTSDLENESKPSESTLDQVSILVKCSTESLKPDEAVSIQAISDSFNTIADPAEELNEDCKSIEPIPTQNDLEVETISSVKMEQTIVEETADTNDTEITENSQPTSDQILAEETDNDTLSIPTSTQEMDLNTSNSTFKLVEEPVKVDKQEKVVCTSVEEVQVNPWSESNMDNTLTQPVPVQAEICATEGQVLMSAEDEEAYKKLICSENDDLQEGFDEQPIGLNLNKLKEEAEYQADDEGIEMDKGVEELEQGKLELKKQQDRLKAKAVLTFKATKERIDEGVYCEADMRAIDAGKDSIDIKREGMVFDESCLKAVGMDHSQPS